MTRRHARNARTRQRFGGIEPVALGDVSDAECAEPLCEAEWRAPDRGWGAPRERADRIDVEMIVVIVRLQDQIDRRQRGERESWRHETARSGERNRRDAIREDGIGEHVEAADLDEETRVPDPGDAATGRGRRPENRVGRYRLWRRSARAKPEFAGACPIEHPLERVAEPVLDRARPRVEESAVGAAMRGREVGDCHVRSGIYRARRRRFGLRTSDFGLRTRSSVPVARARPIR